MAVFATVASKVPIQDFIPAQYETITETLCTDLPDPNPPTDPPDDPGAPGPWQCIRRVEVLRCDPNGYCWYEVLYVPCFVEILPIDD